MNKVSVIIVAGGSGKRMNSTVAKQYIQLNGREILSHTIDCFENCSHIDNIVLVVGAADIEYVQSEIVNKYNYKKISNVISGGAERQHSVYNGLKALPLDTDIVLVHDGVRPFVRNQDILNIISQTAVYGSCVLGVKVKDTIKVCDGNGYVINTPDRSFLWSAQTPQSFQYSILMDSYNQAFSDSFLGTDDSMLVERAGHKIKMIEGSYDNIKITTPEDLYIGNSILNKN